MSDLVALRPGTILADDYRIERTLGAGGFGITYLAEEISLARLVTIKEYFPVDFAARDHLEDVVPRSQSSEGDYSWGLDRFLAEAQTLARFTHPNIVRVYRYFLARNTGYIVLHYEDGQSLKGWLRGLGRAPRQPEIDRLLDPLLGALEAIHAADYLHRDIAPDNIMIRRDGAPVLIDFGSARGDIAKHSKTISALVKPGYSPYEQYATTSSKQGPWTDIYSLGATLYEAVTGKRPPDAPSRMVADELIPPSDAALSSYRPAFLAAIAKSLRLEIGERPRSIAVWRTELMAVPLRGAAPKPAAAKVDVVEPVAPVEDSALLKPAGPPAQPSSSIASPGQGGLAAAFLDGWRKAKPIVPASAVAGDILPMPVPPAPVRTGGSAHDKKSAEVVRADGTKVSSPRRKWFAGADRQVAQPSVVEPGARKATPWALRRRANRWRGLVAKLALGFVVAGAAVAIQDHVPTIRREGASLLASQPGIDVPLAQLKGHRGATTGIAYAGDGQQIVTVGLDATLKVWDVRSNSLLRTLELDSGPATALAVTRGRAATGHKDGTIAIWDLEAGSKVATLKRNDASIWALVFAGRSDRIAAGGQDGAVAVWDTASPAAPQQFFDEHEGAVQSLAFAERGPFLASGSVDGAAKLWHLSKSERVRTYSGHEQAATAVSFDADGRTLATASSDGQIRLWSVVSKLQKRKFKGHSGPIGSLAFAPLGDHLVSAGNDGALRFWDAKSGRLLRTLMVGAGPVVAIAIAPDGKRFSSAGADGMIRVWDAAIPKAGS